MAVLRPETVPVRVNKVTFLSERLKVEVPASTAKVFAVVIIYPLASCKLTEYEYPTGNETLYELAVTAEVHDLPLVLLNTIL